MKTMMAGTWLVLAVLATTAGGCGHGRALVDGRVVLGAEAGRMVRVRLTSPVRTPKGS